MKKIQKIGLMCLVINIFLVLQMFGGNVFALNNNSTESEIIELSTTEIMPMMARNSCYTSPNQMNQQVLRDQAPVGVTMVHNAHSSTGQPHVHFLLGSLNLDGSVHDGIEPTLTKDQRAWLLYNGWGVN